MDGYIGKMLRVDLSTGKLWDEPLNFIDLMSREQIEDVILECEPTILFVEHDRWFIDRVATGGVELP